MPIIKLSVRFRDGSIENYVVDTMRLSNFILSNTYLNGYKKSVKHFLKHINLDDIYKCDNNVEMMAPLDDGLVIIDYKKKCAIMAVDDWRHDTILMPRITDTEELLISYLLTSNKPDIKNGLLQRAVYLIEALQLGRIVSYNDSILLNELRGKSIHTIIDNCEKLFGYMEVKMGLECVYTNTIEELLLELKHYQIPLTSDEFEVYDRLLKCELGFGY